MSAQLVTLFANQAHLPIELCVGKGPRGCRRSSRAAGAGDRRAACDARGLDLKDFDPDDERLGAARVEAPLGHLLGRTG